MIRTTDAPLVGSPASLARGVAAGQRGALELWPRLAEILTRATLQTQQRVIDATLRALRGFLARDPAALDAWVEAAGDTQRSAFEVWSALLQASAELGDVTRVELQYSARALLDELQQERATREQVERQREREREARHGLERERDQHRERADEERKAREQAERTVQRLEKELAQQRQRAEQAEAQVAQAQASEPTAVHVRHREDDWAVVRGESKRATRVFNTKREAVQEANEIAKREGAEVRIEPD